MTAFEGSSFGTLSAKTLDSLSLKYWTPNKETGFVTWTGNTSMNMCHTVYKRSKLMNEWGRIGIIKWSFLAFEQSSGALLLYINKCTNEPQASGNPCQDQVLAQVCSFVTEHNSDHDCEKTFKLENISNHYHSVDIFRTMKSHCHPVRFATPRMWSLKIKREFVWNSSEGLKSNLHAIRNDTRQGRSKLIT
jgi:hypothetical protein